MMSVQYSSKETEGGSARTPGTDATVIKENTGIGAKSRCIIKERPGEAMEQQFINSYCLQEILLL